MLDYKIVFLESSDHYQKVLVTKKYENQSPYSANSLVSLRSLNEKTLKLIGDHGSSNLNTDNVMLTLSDGCMTIEYYAILNNKSGRMVNNMTAATKRSIGKWISNYNIMKSSFEVVKLLDDLIVNKVEDVNKYLKNLFEYSANNIENNTELLESSIIQLQNIINMSFPYEMFDQDEMNRYQDEMLFAIVSSYKEYKGDSRINIENVVNTLKK